MSVFVDKKFESLDWISQATEPIDSELNIVLGKMPEQVDIDFNTYVSIVGDSWDIGLDIRRAVSFFLKKIDVKISDYVKRKELENCFEFQVDGNPVVDFEVSQIYGGTLSLIKVQSTMDEKVLKDLLGRQGIEEVDMIGQNMNIARTNEIMEILGGCESHLATRSARKKKYGLRLRLQKLFAANEWNIKDTELADKVGTWIARYIKTGDLSAYTNFCKLKVMTHKGNPIYSMEEVE
jgi:hypothetical protein